MYLLTRKITVNCGLFLVAALSISSVRAEPLPSDASALTDGNFYVDANSVEKPEDGSVVFVQNFTGNIGLSKYATLFVTPTYSLNVEGAVDVGGTTGGGILAVGDVRGNGTSLNIKNGGLNVNSGTLTIKGKDAPLINSYRRNSTVNVSGDNGINIGGSSIVNMSNGALNYATNGGSLNITGGKFDMTDSIIGMESEQIATDFSEVTTKTTVVVDATPPDPSIPDDPGTPGSREETTNTEIKGNRPAITETSGTINITGGDFIMKGQSVLSKLNMGNFNISGGTFNLNKTDTSGKVASILNGSSSGNINISGGEINLYNNSKIIRAWVETTIDQVTTGPTTVTDTVNSDDGKTHTTTEVTTETIKGDNLVKDFVMNGSDYVLHTPSAGEVAATGSINILGGKINLNNNSEIAVHTSDGKINISGGIVTANGSSKLNSDNGTVMSGGTLNLNDSASVLNGLNMTTASLNIKGTASLIDSNLKAKDSAINIAQNSTINTPVLDLTGSTNLNMQDGASVKADKVSLSDLGILNVAKDATLNVKNTTFKGSSKVNLVDGGSLKVTGTGGLVSFENSSELNLGLAKLMANDNDVSFADNSNVKIKINGSGIGESGTIQAKNINIGAGSNMNVTLAPSIVSKGESIYAQVLDATTVNGEFNINKNNRYAINYVSDAADPEHGKYKVTGIANAEDVAKKTTSSQSIQKEASAWLDSGNLNGNAQTTAVLNILDDLSQNDATAFVDALSVLAPDSAAQVQTVSSNNVVQLYNVVGTRLAGGSAMNNAPRQGYASGDSNGYSDLADNGGVWVQGLYSKSTLDDTEDSKGFEAETTGGAFGIDGRILEDLKVGAGFSYTTTDVDGYMRTTEVDSSTGFVYAEYKPNRWYINGIASYGVSSYDEEKNVAGIKVKGSYDADVMSGQIMTGYKYGIFAPEIGARYVNVSQDEYTDSVGQKIKVDDSSILTGIVGVRVGDTFEPNYHLRLRPEFRIAATYDFDNDGTNAVVSLPNAASYTVTGEGLDKFGVEVGAGVTMDIGNALELAARYEGTFKSDYDNHTGMVDLKYKF